MMNIDLISIGMVIQTYLKENHVSIASLSKQSKVAERLIHQILMDEIELSADVAIGIHELIPEITVEFLMNYKTKYKVQHKTNGEVWLI